MEFKTITVVAVPGINSDITVANGASLKDVLDVYTEQTGNTIEQYDVRLNDSTAAMTVIPANGSKVYLVKKVKGNR